ncbi:serine--tRNA ligase, partial [Candidatus Bathyarchaeota archaeon]|nr:serine--tRNA ligase [Candidatus Bathyarchaeota archaeon]
MLDIKLIREHPEVVRANLEKRGAVEKLKVLDDLVEYDEKWRRLLTELNKLRHKRKVITAEIASLKKKGKDVSKKLEEARRMPEKIERLEKQVKSYK